MSDGAGGEFMPDGAGPFSMLSVAALESYVETFTFAGKKYAAIQYRPNDGGVTPLMIFCRGLLGYDKYQQLVLKGAPTSDNIVGPGDWIVMVSRTEYAIMRLNTSESLFSLMPEVPLSTPENRLARIAQAHVPNKGEGGLTDGLCGECNWSMPCPTHVWASDEGANRDPLMCWDPADDDRGYEFEEEGVEDGA